MFILLCRKYLEWVFFKFTRRCSKINCSLDKMLAVGLISTGTSLCGFNRSHNENRDCTASYSSSFHELTRWYRVVASGGPVVPGPTIWNQWPPISRLASRLLHTSNTVFEKCKNVTPLLFLGPSILFLVAPPAKSWRPACVDNLYYLKLAMQCQKGQSITGKRWVGTLK